MIKYAGQDSLASPLNRFKTLVAAIAKKGKPMNDPAGLRTVGLESCMLKFVTLLMHKRLYDWAERHGILPASQNGFREGYRTNNNAFVLRCMIERARASDRSLFVAFVELSNAFPSTDQDTLWLRLHDMGVSGCIFDWLRMLYARMSYMVKLGDVTSP